jgi:hypothetical protein
MNNNSNFAIVLGKKEEKNKQNRSLKGHHLPHQ